MRSLAGTRTLCLCYGAFRTSPRPGDIALGEKLPVTVRAARLGTAKTGVLAPAAKETLRTRRLILRSVWLTREPSSTNLREKNCRCLSVEFAEMPVWQTGA